LAEFSIQSDKFFLTGRHIIFVIDGFFGAFGDANGTIDTLIGVNHQEVGTDAEAVDRTNRYTSRIGAIDARFTDNVCHDVTPLIEKYKKLFKKVCHCTPNFLDFEG